MINFNNKQIEIEKPIQLKKFLKENNINISTVVCLKDGQIVTEDYVIRKEDNINIIKVISGG